MIKKFSSATQKIGERGEKVALIFLKKHGHVLRETNYSCIFGEIDIVSEKDGELFFIEVKTVELRDPSIFTSGNTNELYLPSYNLSGRKLEKLTKSVLSYLSAQGVSHETPYSLNLLSVFIFRGGERSFVRFTRNISSQ